MDGGESGARANSNEFPCRASTATADDESVRASESRDKEADSCGEHIPECAITREVGDGSVDGDERGLAK